MTQALLAFLVNAVWQAGLVAAVGLLLARRLESARLRFRFLALTLVAATAAPLLTLLPHGNGSAGVAIALPRVEPRGAQVVAAAYVAGLLLVALRLGRAAARALRIAASATAIDGRTRVSTSIDSPVTIGRTIILPPSLLDDAPLRAAALAHETAHVRRNDYAVHVALELAALPLYFHPAMLLLRRAIAEAREIACDEEAAAQCGDRAYAAALVRIASMAVARRAAAAVGMASTPIERRVEAVTRRRRRSARRAASLALVVPMLVAAACSRVDVAPSIAEGMLCGRWALVPETSDFREMSPSRYDEYTQTIEQGPTRLAVRQQRVANGKRQEVSWSVITDGVSRPIRGIPSARGSARWERGRLTVALQGPGAHRETATAFVRGGRLICDGQTDRGRFHAEFRRIDP